MSTQGLCSAVVNKHPNTRLCAGKGTFLYKSGDKYQGDWQNGLRCGLGTLWTFADNRYRMRYNGQWKDDVPWVSNCNEHRL